MFHRILMPVDGSLSMEHLVRQGLQFAASITAHVTVVHVLTGADSAGAAAAGLAAGTGTASGRGRRVLQQAAISAELSQVSCDTSLLYSDEPWRAILQAASDSGCDLICMLSHGRPRPCEQRIGGQAARLLEHTPLPVLLFR